MMFLESFNEVENFTITKLPLEGSNTKVHRYLSYITTFSSRKTLSKVKTRETKTCNYLKTFQKRGTSRSSTFQCHWKSRADDAI